MHGMQFPHYYYLLLLLLLAQMLCCASSFHLPPLTDLDDALAVRQNHEFSSTANWVILGIMMQGQNPESGEGTIEERMRAIRENDGVTKFVCLQTAEAPPQTADDSVTLGDGYYTKSASTIMSGFAN
jgi:hypothetical protein